jgi:hypothetical protein
VLWSDIEPVRIACRLAEQEVRGVFEACRYGVPVLKLQESIDREAAMLHARQNGPLKVGGWDVSLPATKEALTRRSLVVVQLFERFCSTVQNGYVLESSHPYADSEIDQCVEVLLDPQTPGPLPQGVCIAFDPRSDTRAGDGHISFLLEGPSRPGSAEQREEPGAIHEVRGVSRLFRGRGLLLNTASKAGKKGGGEGKQEGGDEGAEKDKEEGGDKVGLPRNEGGAGAVEVEGEGGIPEVVWPDEQLALPGVNGNPPLFMPSNRFIIR